jgi:hypothetical protein
LERNGAGGTAIFCRRIDRLVRRHGARPISLVCRAFARRAYRANDLLSGYDPVSALLQSHHSVGRYADGKARGSSVPLQHCRFCGYDLR